MIQFDINPSLIFSCSPVFLVQLDGGSGLQHVSLLSFGAAIQALLPLLDPKVPNISWLECMADRDILDGRSNQNFAEC